MSLLRLKEAVSDEGKVKGEQAEAVERIFPSAEIVGNYILDRGAVVMTLFYHSQYGVGALMTHTADGTHYSSFVHRDRFPDRGLTGSDWENRSKIEVCLRQSQQRVKRLLREGCFVKCRLEQVQVSTGEIRRGVKQEKG